MTITWLLLSLTGFISIASGKSNFNCEYQVEYSNFDGKDAVVLQSLSEKLKGCNSKMPCGDEKHEFEYSSTEKPIRVNHRTLSNGKNACLETAKRSCRIVRQGIIKKKLVKVTFDGQPQAEYECEHKSEIKERKIEPNAAKPNPVAPAPLKSEAEVLR